jgi:hypothetical protein
MATSPPCPGRERDLDAVRPEKATKVLRLGSAHRDWKSTSSARLAQDDGTGKQYLRRGLIEANHDGLGLRSAGDILKTTEYSVLI